MRSSREDYIWVAPNLLSPEACAAWIRRTETIGYARAPVTTAKGPQMRPDIRNNRRVMQDNPQGAEDLWKKVKPLIAWNGQGAEPVGLNMRFRFYRYEPGERFAPHYDGYYERPGTGIRSLYTCMVYLNDDFEGGQTRFFEHGHVIEPRTGMGLFFVHRQLHEGAEVTRGRKYVLRTDVMYDLSPFR